MENCCYGQIGIGCEFGDEVQGQARQSEQGVRCSKSSKTRLRTVILTTVPPPNPTRSQAVTTHTMSVGLFEPNAAGEAGFAAL